MSGIEYLTENAEIIRSDRKTVSVSVTGGKLTVRAPRRMAISRIIEIARSHTVEILRLAEKDRKISEASGEPFTEDEIKDLYRLARRVLPQRTEHFARLLGTGYGRITIRLQKTRWGSCSSKKNLSFNAALMATPEKVIDSVVAHELCHTIEMNHSERFYRLLYGIFPEYDACRLWLKHNGPAILKKTGR